MKGKMKGQLTIEFIMILAIVFILFDAISLDLISSSTSDSIIIQNSEIAKMASIAINSTAEAFRFQGSGAKTSLFLRAPSDCDYLIYLGNITLSCIATSPVFSGLNNTLIAKSALVTFECPQCPLVGGVRRIVSGNASQVFITKS